eukprot:s93_g20.t1
MVPAWCTAKKTIEAPPKPKVAKPTPKPKEEKPPQAMTVTVTRFSTWEEEEPQRIRLDLMSNTKVSELRSKLAELCVLDDKEVRKMKLIKRRGWDKGRRKTCPTRFLCTTSTSGPARETNGSVVGIRLGRSREVAGCLREREEMKLSLLDQCCLFCGSSIRQRLMGAGLRGLGYQAHSFAERSD